MKKTSTTALESFDTSPTHCRAAVFTAVGEPFQIREFLIPQLAEGESLVRVELCTVCGSDLHTIFGRRQEPMPIILGHEMVGVVEQMTSTVHDLRGHTVRTGDRVVWAVTRCCHGCRHCRNGIPQKCVRVKKFGHQSVQGDWPLSGGYSEYCRLPKGTSLLRVPSEIPSEVICPASCVTATAAAAIRYARPKFADRVLILGGGLMGLTTAAMVHSQTGSVTLCDTAADRLQRASEFHVGRTVLPEELQHENDASDHYDIIFEMSGHPDAVETAFSKAAIGGRVILAGSVMPSRPTTINPEQIVRRLLQIQGVHNYAPQDLITAVDFLASHYQTIPFASVIEKTFPLDAIDDAIVYASQYKPIRVAIQPGKTNSGDDHD